MPRLPGGPATDLPACPRPGHSAHRVVKDGHFGTPPRQRFRCIGPAGFHRFVPELPRREAHDSVCDTCDTHVPAHRGLIRHWTQVRLPRPRGRDSPHRRRCRRVVPAGGAASPRRLGASPPGRRLGRQHRRRVAGHLRTGRDGGARGDRLARNPGAGLDPVHGHQHLDRDHLGRLRRAGRLRLPREGTRSPAGVGAGRLPPGHARRVGGLPATTRHEHRTGPGHQRRRR